MLRLPILIVALALAPAGPLPGSLGGAQDPATPPATPPERPPERPPEPPGEAPEAAPLPASQLLETWLKRFRNAKRVWWSGWGIEYRQLLPQVGHELQRSPEDLRRCASLLLALAAEGLDGLPSSSMYLGSSDLQRTRRGAAELLEELMVGGAGQALVEWLAGDVLALRDRHSTSERFVAMYLLDRHRSTAFKLALLSVARDPDDPVRPDALELLARWPDPAVDVFLVGLLGRRFDPRERPHPFTLLLTRARGVSEPLGTRAAALLEGRLQTMLLSSDWREAARAIELSVGLSPDRRVPLLIDSLSAWDRRTKMGSGSRRVLDDLVRELQAISGRSIGTNPRNWITWWLAYREGKTPLHVEREPDAPRSTTSFFGLRPVSDRVTFVIDISGSMQATWRTEEHSRYVEAVEQIMRYLQGLGEQASFNVILFSDSPLQSSPQLVRATSSMLTRARDSLLPRVPGGGTHLRPAIELALRLDSDGYVDPARLEADTIIVLCDGETAEGSSWVRPLMDRIQVAAQVRIHCVLVGTQGDGTLEVLADITGGDFVRID